MRRSAVAATWLAGIGCALGCRATATPAPVREPAPTTPTAPSPDGTEGAFRCEALDAAVPVYEEAEPVDDDLLRLGALRAGEDSEGWSGRWFRVRRVDLNGDHLPDHLAVAGEGSDDGFHADCGNYGECRQAVLVGCEPSAHALVVAPVYAVELSVGDDTAEVGERPWREILITTRAAGSQAGEYDRMEAGEPVVARTAWVWTGQGYRARP